MNREESNKEFGAMASVLADGYIIRNNKPSVEALLKNEGAEYVPGKLYAAHVKAIQMLMMEEFKLIGLDLVKEVEKRGEQFVLGQLSKYENAIVVNKVATLGCVVERIRELKEGK